MLATRTPRPISLAARTVKRWSRVRIGCPSACTPSNGRMGLRTGALELVGHGAPPRVTELPGVVSLTQVPHDAPAGGRRRQHRLHVVVEGDVDLDVLRGDRSGRRGSPFLGCCSAALRRAPPPWSSWQSRKDVDDGLTASRAGPHGLVRLLLLGHRWRSSSSVHAITVDARQRTCLPTRKPVGPYPLVRQQ